MRRFWPLGTALFCIVLLADQYTKYLISTGFALGESVKALPGLRFTYVQNTGSLFGLFQDSNTAFIWLSVMAFGILLYFHDEFSRPAEKIAYALILAGLFGNLLDRLFRGFVVDFLDLGWWPVFNIADSAICIGIGLYIAMQIQNSSKSDS